MDNRNKTKIAIYSLNVNEKRHLFGCPDFVSLKEIFLMARK